MVGCGKSGAEMEGDEMKKLSPEAWSNLYSEVCSPLFGVELTEAQAVAIMKEVAARARLQEDPVSALVLRMFCEAERRAGDRSL